ncbi:hypothetical protein HXX76_002350 [Chlamydomonas incerta]|uniref:Uncharacterized protein n=1 Tax=Chlamydomonas incerta TaxID=51695 RepID=A0A835TF54_CHLIN|nr:hypothetical protein HXX76_002350 [Chlamydomonas incerta]|eukprot:KAG2442263.1 hypothetical protein HXX76_002350 [Chlamydomonas incerta]
MSAKQPPPLNSHESIYHAATANAAIQVGEATKKVQQVDNKVDALTSEVSSVKTEVASLDGKVSALKDDLATIKEQLAAALQRLPPPKRTELERAILGMIKTLRPVIADKNTLSIAVKAAINSKDEFKSSMQVQDLDELVPQLVEETENNNEQPSTSDHEDNDDHGEASTDAEGEIDKDTGTDDDKRDSGTPVANTAGPR